MFLAKSQRRGRSGDDSGHSWLTYKRSPKTRLRGTTNGTGKDKASARGMHISID